MSDQVKLIYLRPENWRSKSQTHEILGWCKEAPKVEEHIAVWVRPIEKTPTPVLEQVSAMEKFDIQVRARKRKRSPSQIFRELSPYVVMIEVR